MSIALAFCRQFVAVFVSSTNKYYRTYVLQGVGELPSLAQPAPPGHDAHFAWKKQKRELILVLFIKQVSEVKVLQGFADSEILKKNARSGKFSFVLIARGRRGSLSRYFAVGYIALLTATIYAGLVCTLQWCAVAKSGGHALPGKNWPPFQVRRYCRK